MITQKEYEQGFVLCPCKKFAHVFRASMVAELPEGYSGELCPDCGMWVCSAAVLLEMGKISYWPTESKKLKCEWLDCYAGLGLAGHGDCFGAWWMQCCPEFKDDEEWEEAISQPKEEVKYIGIKDY